MVLNACSGAASGNGDMFERSRKIDSREEMIKLFGNDALYLPEGFGNDLYTLTYLSYNIDKALTGEYDPFIERYGIIHFEEENQQIIFLSERLKGKAPSSREPIDELPKTVTHKAGHVCDVDYIYIMDTLIHIYTAEDQVVFEFDFNDNYYILMYVDYDPSLEYFQDNSHFLLLQELFDDYELRNSQE